MARDVELHRRTSAFTSERVVSPGRTTGLLQMGERVTFEGRHFGLRLRLTAEIVDMQRPRRFVDQAVKSGFASLRHVHEFKVLTNGVTEMIDVVEWKLPAGIIGRLADWLFVKRHMAWFMRTKQDALKAVAEHGGGDNL